MGRGGRYYNREIGKIGEDLACDYLKKHGYEILERNWGNKWGEIDIIAKLKTKETIVFVEVKTKVGEDYGQPENMINKRKLFQVLRMAQIYEPALKFPKRIDVVAIVLNNDLSLKRLSHYEAVY